MAQQSLAPHYLLPQVFQLLLFSLATLSVAQAWVLHPQLVQDLKAAITRGHPAATNPCPCKGTPLACPAGFPQQGCLRLSQGCICGLPSCNSTTPCVAGTSCDPAWGKCFASPRRLGDPCSSSNDCGPNLSCSTEIGLCVISVNTSSPSPAPEPSSSANRTTLSAAPVTSLADLLLDSPCMLTSQCSQGLVCTKCPGGNDGMTCRPGKWTMPPADYDRPYNKVPWLVAHNAYAQNVLPQNSWAYPIFLDQDLSITDQLNFGARGLMLDVYLVNGAVYLCHSYCDFGKIPLGNVLSEIKTWMDANPSEIVTIFFEDYVSGSNPGLLSSAFSTAGLTPYLFPPQSMPTDGSDWPSVRTMAQIGRLVVWTDARGGDFPWEWDHSVEAMYGTAGMDSSTCPTRDNGSSDLSDPSRSMVLVNWFGDLEASNAACQENAFAKLQTKLQTCYAAAGNRWANFLAVDFLELSIDGGAFQALDWLSQQWRASAP